MTDDTTVRENCDMRNCENNICRICLTFTDLLLPIFNGEGAEQDLETKIQKYLPVKISVDDSLPHQVCYQCADALISWDSLIAICLESDKKLKYLLKIRPEESQQWNDKESELAEKDVRNEAAEELISLENKHSSKRLKRKHSSDDQETQKDVDTVGSGSAGSDLATDALDMVETRLNVSEDVESGKELTCQFCGKAYKGKRYLARHIKVSHKEERQSVAAHKCEVCPNVYKTKANLERHYEKEHVNNQVECPVCHASVHSRKLESHLKSIHGVKVGIDGERDKFKCKFCDKWFRNKYIRNLHMKEVHLTEPVKCKLCDFQGARSVVRRHKAEVHAEKRFPCSLCNSAFKTLHTLKLHMTSHSDLRSFTCDICGMGFKRLNNVRDHMKCHEQKSNQCQICGNFFARKRYLAIHEKTIHNFYADGVIPEEKGFECGICGAKLKWKKNLLAHMRIHTGEKPYVCKICKMDFVCHGSLRTHMSKHGVCAVKESNMLGTPVESVRTESPASTVGIEIIAHFSVE